MVDEIIKFKSDFEYDRFKNILSGISTFFTNNQDNLQCLKRYYTSFSEAEAEGSFKAAWFNIIMENFCATRDVLPGMVSYAQARTIYVARFGVLSVPNFIESSNALFEILSCYKQLPKIMQHLLETLLHRANEVPGMRVLLFEIQDCLKTVTQVCEASKAKAVTSDVIQLSKCISYQALLSWLWDEAKEAVEGPPLPSPFVTPQIASVYERLINYINAVETNKKQNGDIRFSDSHARIKTRMADYLLAKNLLSEMSIVANNLQSFRRIYSDRCALNMRRIALLQSHTKSAFGFLQRDKGIDDNAELKAILDDASHI